MLYNRVPPLDTVTLVRPVPENEETSSVPGTDTRDPVISVDAGSNAWATTVSRTTQRRYPWRSPGRRKYTGLGLCVDHSLRVVGSIQRRDEDGRWCVPDVK